MSAVQQPITPSQASHVTDLSLASAEELLVLYRSKQASPVEAVNAVLARIERLEPKVNAFVLLDPQAALSAARESEARWQKGAPIGLVDGVPAALKDLIWARNWPTLRGSLSIDPKQDWNEDAPATARLREHGAVLLGKTTTSEYGWTALADSPLTGITRNPWDLSRTAGGSSGGSAAGAALGFGPLHVATDGGGSTRLPAANSGVVGFKPTFGRVPGYPSAHTGTLFHVTPLTRTVGDAALLLQVIAQPDPRDWNALPAPSADWLNGLDRGVAGLRIAFSPDLGYAEVDPEVAELVAQAAAVFTELGATVVRADPGIKDPLPDYRVLADAAVARLLASLTPAERERVDPNLQAVGARGSLLDAVTYLAAVQAREAFGRHLALFHRDYDLLITPSTAVPALPADHAGTTGTRGVTPSAFAYPFNFSQQPAISVPAGLTKAGLPVGLQIVGAKYNDALVLRAARAFEFARPFARPADPA
ncbi:amidase [Lacisediminimonas profundi]|uniref:amidase n=1 Tax=Lacisediminimonas profundi TaxID=2603856 RepID=UPI00124AEC49|nr:amidase [Lacisediminimonas profundi]